MNPFKAIENLILGPPRLFVRTLDDFHALVEIASDTNRRLDHIEELVALMTQQLEILVTLVQAMQVGADTVLAMAKRMDTIARDVMALGDRVDAGPETFRDISSRFEEVAGQMQQRAKELAEQGAEVAAAVPILQRAMDVAGPSLEGALSRLGQLMAPSQPAPPGAAGDDEPAKLSSGQAKPSAPRKPPAPKPRPAAGEA